MPQIIERIAASKSAPIAPTRESSLQTNTHETATQTQEGGANAPGTEKPALTEAQRLEALARREKQLRRERAQIAQEKAASSQSAQLQKQLEDLQRENAQMKGWVQRFYRNPVEVLNEAGVPGDVITQGLLNQPSREAVSIRALQHQIAQIQEQNKALETKVTEGQQAQYDQAKNQIRADAKQLISTDAETYEAISRQGDEAIDAVVELIEQT